MTVEPHYHERASELEPVRFEKPFTKKNWKNAGSRERWSELIPKMAAAKSFAEWYSVVDDHTDRKAAIIHVNNRNREKWLRRMNEHDLYYRDIRYSEPYSGFSHKHYPTDRSDPERITYAVVSQDEEVVEHMKDAELHYDSEDKHEVVGRYLGFPQCCREFFNEKWVGGKIDPMYEIACNTPSAERVSDDPDTVRVDPQNPRANVMWRYLGLSFITHLPCSWECERSLDVAQERYRIMAENGYQEEAEALNRFLSEPFVWSGLKGIAHLKNRWLIGETSSSSYWKEKKIVWREENPPE